ncbi:hypothetical protein [Myxococcus sp. Y35]|uniref:hypothetical protein n=1 Tax=Pseudomyxococcus flavus TaxID=3115648 RepID=UPI003CED382E
MTSLLDVNEAAARLRCSTRRVFELLSDGTLVRGPKFGRKTVITAESVEAALVPPAPLVLEPTAPPKLRAPRDFRSDLARLAEQQREQWRKR